MDDQELPGYFVDLKPVLDAYDPLRSVSARYVQAPALREAVRLITVKMIIECTFVLPAHDLQENGMTHILYEYIEHSVPKALAMFELDSALWMELDCLVNDIVEATDGYLRHTLAPYTRGYENYVFDHWAAESLATFLLLKRS